MPEKAKTAIPRDERLIVALDVPTAAEAKALVGKLGDAVRFYKVGLELFSAAGYFELVEWLAGRGHRVFADLKLYDIPETVGRAVATPSRFSPASGRATWTRWVRRKRSCSWCWTGPAARSKPAATG